MTRTWTVTDTLSDLITLADGDITQPSDKSHLAFAVGSSPGFKIYKWSPGGSFIDISGSTFEVSDYNVYGLCYFKDDLYVYHTIASNGQARLSVYSGSGQSWSTAYDVVDRNGNALKVYQSVIDVGHELVADDDIMLLTANSLAGGSEHSIIATSDGSSFSHLTIDGGYGYWFYWGRSAEHTDYGRVLVQARTTTGTPHNRDHILTYNAGLVRLTDPDANVTTVTESNRFQGYSGTSFAAAGYYSPDFMETRIDAGDAVGFPYWIDENNTYASPGEDVYKLVAGPGWEADGSVDAGSTVIGFYAISNHIYAIGTDGSDTIIWDGGTLTPADRRLYIFRGVRDEFGNYTFSNKLVETA